jgi:8-oxo-dGTP diphosphatase
MQELASLRKNTNYYDGFYGLVSGHVEDGEPASKAILREAREEADIQALHFLKPVHCMHRKTNRFNIDIFFACSSWSGDICNREVHKCAQLEFHPIDRLPQNIIPYIEKALKAWLSSEFYSEEGWD